MNTDKERTDFEAWRAELLDLIFHYASGAMLNGKTELKRHIARIERQIDAVPRAGREAERAEAVTMSTDGAHHGAVDAHLMCAEEPYVKRAGAVTDYRSEYGKKLRFAPGGEAVTDAEPVAYAPQDLRKKLDKHGNWTVYAVADPDHTASDMPLYTHAPRVPSPDAEPLHFTYRNWRGEISERRVMPVDIRFGTTEWHPEPQWFLVANDLDKGETRWFAMRDIGAGKPEPSPDVEKRYAGWLLRRILENGWSKAQVVEHLTGKWGSPFAALSKPSPDVEHRALHAAASALAELEDVRLNTLHVAHARTAVEAYRSALSKPEGK